MIQVARDWGVSRELVTQILVSAVHISLGREALISNQQHRALEHFESTIAIGINGGDTKLVIKARCNEQVCQLKIASTS